MDDLISRQAAIKAIDDLPNCYNGFSDTYDKACIIGVLEELPPIDPVKHAKWELVDEAEPRRYGCSLCKRLSFYMTHSCPHCGAAMEAKEWDREN